MRFWAVIGIALTIGAAVHGVRWYKARERQRLDEALDREYAALTFTASAGDR